MCVCACVSVRVCVCADLMASIQESLSPALEALMVYDWCFPSTTLPSVSVLQALIFCLGQLG